MSKQILILRRIFEPYTYRAFHDLDVRIYPDERPGNLDIANLHKGLILIRSGEELVEEGAGFGVPVARFKDKTYFSGYATLTLLNEGPPPILKKSYLLDTVSIKSLNGIVRISDALYHPLHRAFSRIYLSRPKFRRLFNKIIEMRMAMGVTTSFVKVAPRGMIDIRYTLLGDLIEVEVITDRISNDCEELVILNEQGASTFRRYRDSDGLDLIDDAIGAWDRIEAPEGSISDMKGEISFSIKKPNVSQTMYRGREKFSKRLSWTGIALSTKPSGSLKYSIQLKREV